MCPFGSPWIVEEAECAPAVVCGECPPGICCEGVGGCPGATTFGTNRCPVDQICMRMQYADGSWTWDCAPDNCAPAALDCTCAGNICNQRLGEGFQCTGASGPTITCEPEP